MNSKNPLILMPLLVKHEILKKLDFKSILTLRNVCHDLRNYIDEGKHFNIRTIYVKQGMSKIHVIVVTKSLMFFYIDFFLKLHQPTVKCGDQTKTIIIEYADEFFKTFQEVLKYFLDLFQKKILHVFSIETDHDSNIKGWERLFNAIENCLQSMSNPLQVANIRLRGNGNALQQLLPYCDERHIKKVELQSRTDCHELVISDELRTSPQWIKAREFISRNNLYVGPIENVLHFSKLDIFIKSFTTADLIFLKDSLLQSPHFQSLHFHERKRVFSVHGWRSEVDENKDCDIYSAFGKCFKFTPNDSKYEWHIEIPDSKEFMLITFMGSHLSFSRVPVSAVPRNAIR